jgi:glycosyltransferase involved in cell wall biosynthesis
MSMKKISVLLPAYNEEASIPTTYASISSIINDLSQYEWEILFVNDGSVDRTEELLLQLHGTDSRVNVLSLSRNFGKENAMLAGMDYVTGDATIIMDADGQDSVNIVPQMLSEWEAGYEDVYAMRKSRGEESWLRRKLSLTYYKLLQHSTDINVLPNVGDFRLLDRRCINALRSLRETQRYTKGLFCWIGYKKQGIMFDRNDRRSGKSSFSLWKLFNLAIEGITSYTTTPLRLATFVGLVVSLVAFLYLIYTVVKTLLWGEPVHGYPTLITAILFLGGVQLLSIGIIGEYVGRIFSETKRRPPYIADKYNDTKLEIKL